MTPPNFEGHDGRNCGEHRTVGPHRAWCYDCREWCYPDIPCVGCDRAEEKLDAVRVLVDHARKVSPSPRMTVPLGDLEHALGLRDEPAPMKLGGNDRNGT